MSNPNNKVIKEPKYMMLLNFLTIQPLTKDKNIPDGLSELLITANNSFIEADDENAHEAQNVSTQVLRAQRIGEIDDFGSTFSEYIMAIFAWVDMFTNDFNKQKAICNVQSYDSVTMWFVVLGSDKQNKLFHQSLIENLKALFKTTDFESEKVMTVLRLGHGLQANSHWTQIVEALGKSVKRLKLRMNEGGFDVKDTFETMRILAFLFKQLNVAIAIDDSSEPSEWLNKRDNDQTAIAKYVAFVSDEYISGKPTKSLDDLDFVSVSELL